MAPKKSATVIEQELRELRAWVLAHQGALAARGSDRPGLRGRLRKHWSQEEQRWYRWIQWHDSRFEGDCSHLASQRRALDDMAACAPACSEPPAPAQTPAKRPRPALADASPIVATGTPCTPAASLMEGGLLSPTAAETIARSVRWTPAMSSPGMDTTREDLFRHGGPAVASEPWPFPGILGEAVLLSHPACRRIRPIYEHIRDMRRASGDDGYLPARSRHNTMYQRLRRVQHELDGFTMQVTHLRLFALAADMLGPMEGKWFGERVEAPTGGGNWLMHWLAG